MEDKKLSVNIINSIDVTKTNLLGLSKNELKTILSENNLPKFRADQIWYWIYRSGTIDFDLMTNISKNLRVELSNKFYIWRPEISSVQKSDDGTIKWLLKFKE